MKIPADLAYVFALPFTVSGSAVVIRTQSFGVPLLEVPTLVFKAGRLSLKPAPQRWVFLCLSNTGNETAIKRPRDHIVMVNK